MKSNRQILLDITITRILVMKFSLTILESISLKIQSFLSSDSFKRTIDKTLGKYVPLKKRYVRANQAPFMKKNKLWKEAA